MRYLLLLALILPVLGLACSGSGSEPGTAATASPSAEASVTASPGGGTTTRVPAKAWLVDARTGSATVLFDDLDEPVFSAEFDDGSPVVVTSEGGGPVLLRYDLSGRLQSKEAWPARNDCRDTGTGVEVRGRSYAGAACGVISPDGAWMLYQETVGEELTEHGLRIAITDQHALHLDSDERLLLQAGLRACGGCDGRFGPAWSLSSRFVYFSETGGEGRTFLSDLQRGVTTVISTGDAQLRSQPQWSRVADLLLHRGEGEHLAVLRDPASETVTEFENGIIWPARFDASGKYIYSPAWDDSGGLIDIVEVSTGLSVATLPGQPPRVAQFVAINSVVSSGSTYVAVLEGEPGCADGTAVHIGPADWRCVAGATGATLSPDGSRLVAARKVGTIGSHTKPGGGSLEASIYDIVLVDVRSGVEQVVVRDAVGSQDPLPAIWNEAGTYFLLRSPFEYGL